MIKRRRNYHFRDPCRYCWCQSPASSSWSFFWRAPFQLLLHPWADWIGASSLVVSRCCPSRCRSCRWPIPSLCCCSCSTETIAVRLVLTMTTSASLPLPSVYADRSSTRRGHCPRAPTPCSSYVLLLGSPRIQFNSCLVVYEYSSFKKSAYS